jgi:nucleoside-diphosphate-sugar epimerase
VRALVTGATGLVGYHIVERLLAEGWETRALVRVPAAAADLELRGAQLRQGDVLERVGIARAAQGCDAIFHAAAEVSPRGGWEAFRRTNIQGTGNVVAAAHDARTRLVHISSVAVYGQRERYRRDGPTHEDIPLTPLPEHAHYARSKREAEQTVLAAHARGEIWATAIRPCVIYGPRDRQFVPRVARLLRLGLAPVPGGGGNTLAIVHAASVADAAVRAATRDIAGGRAYNATNDGEITVLDFFRLAAEGLGRPIKPVAVPTWLLELAFTISLGIRKLLGAGTAAVSAAAAVDLLTRDNPFTSRRAREELGWNPPIPPQVGVPASFRWWREQTDTRRHRAGQEMTRA